MQTSTPRFMPIGLPGQIAQPEVETEAMQTGYTGQVSRLTIGDAPYVATTYYVETVVTPGITTTFEYDGTDDADATAAAIGMAAAWNADPTSRALGLASVAVVKNVDIAWADYTHAWTPTLDTEDAATFTHAVQTAASSTTARLGTLVARGAATGNPRDARPLAVLTSATVVGNIRGMVIREDVGIEQTSLEGGSTTFDAYPAGRAVPVMNRGRGWVVCETAMTVGGAIYVRKAGTGIIGAVRNDADGGDAIDISTIAAVEVVGAAGACCCVKLNIPL